jgi:hypothetical protein
MHISTTRTADLPMTGSDRLTVFGIGVCLVLALISFGMVALA